MEKTELEMKVEQLQEKKLQVWEQLRAETDQRARKNLMYEMRDIAGDILKTMEEIENEEHGNI